MQKKIEELTDTELEKLYQEWATSIRRTDQRYSEYLNRLGYRSAGKSIDIRVLELEARAMKDMGAQKAKPIGSDRKKAMSNSERMKYLLNRYDDAKLVLATSGAKTMIGVSYSEKTDFLLEVEEDEIETVVSSLGRRPTIINYTVPKGKKSVAVDMGQAKFVVKKDSVGRLWAYWRFPNPESPGGYMDIFCEQFADTNGNDTSEDELARYLERHSINPKSVIREKGW